MGMRFSMRFGLKALLVIGGILRLIYSLGITPNAFTDNLHHLKNTLLVIQDPSALFFMPGPTFPLYYLINSIVLSILPVEYPFTRLLPLLLQGIQILLVYKILTHFTRDYIALLSGLTLVLFHPMLIRYGGLNYTGTLAGVFALMGAWFFLKNKDKESLAGFALACATKISGFLFLPGLLFTRLKKALESRYALIPLLPLIYLVFTRKPETLWAFIKQIARILSPLWFMVHYPVYLVLLPWTFWGMPHFKWPLFNALGLIAFIGLLPVLYGIIKGLPYLKRANKDFHGFFIVSGILFLLACFHTHGDARYMVPFIPFLSIPLALFVDKCSDSKRVGYVLNALVFFVVYSIALTIGTILLYAGGY